MPNVTKHRIFILISLHILFLVNRSIGQIQQPATPQSNQFQSINASKSANFNIPGQQFNPILPNDPNTTQNFRIMQQGGMILPGYQQNSRSKQLEEYKKFLAEDAADSKKSNYDNFLKQTSPYRENFLALTNLNPDKFSLATATFLSESAGYNNPVSFEQFKKAIKGNADAIRQSMKMQGLYAKNNVAINYALMQFFGKPFTYKDPKTGKQFKLKSFMYDFEDFWGDKDFNKQSILKLLATRSGQCHSMPLMYLLLCEELGGKAWLVKTPQHSFVRFYDEQGTAYNYETTSGQLISNSFYLQSGYISTAALKNGIYMDTLSNRQMYSSAITDLIIGFTNKFYDDAFTESALAKAIETDPKNLQAYITRSNTQTQKCKDMLQKVGYPLQQNLYKYPAIQKEIEKRDALYQQLDNFGRQDIPEKAYAAWLKSIDIAKEKQRTAEMAQQLKKEIDRLKKVKIKLLNTKPQ